MNLSFKKYKSYNSESNQIEIKPINVLIGRNNSGKSSVSDVIEFCANPTKYEHRMDQIEGITFTNMLTEPLIKSVFSSSTSGGEINGNHYNFGKNYIGKNIRVELRFAKDRDRMSLNASASRVNPEIESNGRLLKIWDNVARKIGNPFSKYDVLRVFAERDIRPEKDSEKLNIEPNGDGVTNLIHKFINYSKLDSKLVEVELLNALNEIMNPDSYFTDIVVQQIENNDELVWEIFLEEKNGNRIALSESGSGLKTIIIVLANLFLMPEVMNKRLSDIIFIFEELENNLHPALQRNLFNYIKNKLLFSKSTVFFTTHSHVAINIFDKDNDSQILHVMKEDDVSSIYRVDNRFKKYSVFDDLETNASDILQSNGVIWVEGPSDRIYLNKWIEVISEGKIKENVHYQIMFYGGRLLSHLSFDVFRDNDVDEFIKLMNLNRNSIIIIDSDKKSKYGKINKTKQRIRDEFKCNGSMCWITAGKEIENYLDRDLILSTLNLKSKHDFDDYQRIDEFLEKVKKGEGTKFLRSKVSYANVFSENLKFENMHRRDLKEKTNKIVKEIKLWNYIKE